MAAAIVVTKIQPTAMRKMVLYSDAVVELFLGDLEGNRVDGVHCRGVHW
jgi:hypothetical protein